MIIIWTSVTKCRYETDNWTSLFFRVHVSHTVCCWIKYLSVVADVWVVSFQGIDGCYGAVILVFETIPITMYFVRIACPIDLELADGRIDSFDTKGHIAINTPLIHLFMIERLRENGGESPQQDFFPLIRTILVTSNGDIFYWQLPKIWWYQIGRFGYFLYFGRYNSLCQPYQQCDIN